MTEVYKDQIKEKEDQIETLTRQMTLTPKRNGEVYKNLKLKLNKANKDFIKIIIAD